MESVMGRIYSLCSHIYHCDRAGFAHMSFMWYCYLLRDACYQTQMDTQERYT